MKPDTVEQHLRAARAHLQKADAPLSASLGGEDPPELVMLVALVVLLMLAGLLVRVAC